MLAIYVFVWVMGGFSECCDLLLCFLLAWVAKNWDIIFDFVELMSMVGPSTINLKSFEFSPCPLMLDISVETSC